MVATQYYIGNRPTDEGSIRELLLSSLDGAVGKLFEESSNGFMKIFFQTAGPGASADQVDFVLSNDDDGQRVDVYLANALIGSIGEAAIELGTGAIADLLVASILGSISAAPVIGVAITFGGAALAGVAAAWLYNEYVEPYAADAIDVWFGTVDKELVLSNANGDVIGGVKYPDGYGTLSEENAIRNLLDFARSNAEVADPGDGMSIQLYVSDDPDRIYDLRDGDILAKIADALGINSAFVAAWEAKDADGATISNSQAVVVHTTGEISAVDRQALIGIELPKGYGQTEFHQVSIGKIGFGASHPVDDGGIQVLLGTDGDDHAMSGLAAEQIYAVGGTGSDTIRGSAGNDYLYGDGAAGAANSADGVDVIYGYDGQDLLFGRGNTDLLYGGKGEDLIYGGDEVDDQFGDKLYGGADIDTIFGGSGKDAIFGEGVAEFEGNIQRFDQTKAAADDPDSVGGNGAGDHLFGEAGDDVISGGAGDDEIDGGLDNDVLFGDAGKDSIHGGAGNDILFGGTDADSLNGDADWDIAAYWFSSEGLTIDLTNTANSTGEAKGDTYSSIEEVQGSALNDTFIVADNNDISVIVGGDVKGNPSSDHGVDTADFSKINSGTKLTFHSSAQDGQYLLVEGTLTGGISTTLKSIEKVVLTNQIDSIVVNDLANLMQPHGLEIDAGNATGSGDKLDFSGLGERVVIKGSSPLTGLQVKDSNVTFKGIENLITTDHDDIVDAHAIINGEVHLGKGNDTLKGAGVGTKIYTGAGADNITYSSGVLVVDADGSDTITYLGQDSSGTYTRNAASESAYAYGHGGLLKVGFNTAGELVLGTGTAHATEDFMYFSNGNNNPLADSADLTAGIRTGEIELVAWQIMDDVPDAVNRVGNLSMNEFMVASVKEFNGNTYVGGVDPLVLDLDGDGIELTPIATGVGPQFDMDGDEFLEYSGWVGSDDGLLALDANSNGTIDDINELFGGAGQSGFLALADYDDNSDGVIDDQDLVYGDLRVWRDLDGDGVTDAGELFSLSDLSITSIDLTATDDGSQNALNTVARTGSFSYSDGSTGQIGDIEFRINNYDTVYSGDTTVSQTVQDTMPNLKGHGTLADLQVSIMHDGETGTLATTIASVLPTLDVVDLDVLRERAFTILDAWADAPPGDAQAGNNPDVVVLIERDGSALDLYDFAVQVTEDVDQGDGTFVETTFWRFAGGTQIEDSQGNVIDYPTYDDIVAYDPGTAGLGWEVVSGATLDFLERYYGEDIPVEDPASLNVGAVGALGSLLETAQRVVDQLSLRLAMQGGLKDYFTGVDYSVDQDTFVATTDQELVPMFQAIFSAAPADAAGAEAWLQDWKPLIDTLLSDYDRPGASLVTKPFIFTTVVAAYETVGLAASLADAAASLGVPTDVVDYGSGERTGTDDGEIFFMSSGDDTVTSGQGGDVFVFGENFGHDVINDYEESGDDFDVIRFAHLNPEDITATRDGLDLILTVNATGDTVRVVGQFHEMSFSLFGGNILPVQGVEEIVFADGSVWSLPDIALAVSHPESTDDTLIGTDHIDYLEGGAGDDYLSGGDNTDFYFFDAGYGNDVIEDKQEEVLSNGVDVLTFGEGIGYDDLTFSRDGDSYDLTITTAAGDQLTIDGQFWAFYALSQEWLDRIEYFDFAAADEAGNAFTYEDVMDLLIAQAQTDGDDLIYGFSRNDTLDGGAGDDYLSGGNDSDTYIFGFGYGNDTIHENLHGYDVTSDQTDKVSFGAGVTTSDISIARIADSDDVTFTLSDGSTLTIEDQFFANNLGQRTFSIESFEFADGTVWSETDIQDILIAQYQTDGDDVVYGFWYDDTLDGGAGNDYLNAGDGNDTYVFGFGYGTDVFEDGFVSIYTNDSDRVLFGAGVTVSDVTWTRDGDSNDLGIVLSDGSSATVINQFLTNNLGNRYHDIEYFEFADGTVLEVGDIQEALLASTDGDDTIYGFFSADTISGGLGNDLLIGGDGGDTYLFNLGDGHDTIIDGQLSIFVDGADRVVFGAGISTGDISVDLIGGDYDDLRININANDSITVTDYFGNIFDTYKVEEFEFSDGTVWGETDLQAVYLANAATDGDDVIAGFDGLDDVINGGLGNDTILGRRGADDISGGAGNDTLDGGDSEDTITGGLGDDTLAGGADSDTYYYNLGDGNDTLSEGLDSGVTDKIILGSGILAGEVTVTRGTGGDVDDITLTFIDGGSITLNNQYYDSSVYGVEEIHFDDGTVWDHATLRSLYLANAPTSGDDTINGFNGYDEAIDGGAGNDTINGLSGEDTITGGLGDDVLDGGADSDTYCYNLGDGNDTITESLNNGALDKIILGAGILASEVTVTRSTTDTDDVTLTFIDGGSITLNEQFYDGVQYGVEEIHFDDGTVWDQASLRAYLATNSWTENDDVINGYNSSNDILLGGAGNDTINGLSGADAITGGLDDDTLDGGADSDTYYYNLGDGNDTITENLNNGALDKIVLGSGILASDVSVTRSTSDTDDVTLHFTDGGSITLNEQFYDGVQYGVEEIHFDDGTVWDHAALRSLYLSSVQTSGDDTINGFNGQDDVIDGGAGNDTINGLNGEDTLTGGLGDDQLAGGYDSDTYTYNLGDGADTIKEFGAQGALDKIILGAGILASEVTVTRSSDDTDDVTLTFIDGGSLTLDEQFYDGAQYGVEEIHFDDGTVWDPATLRSFYLANAPTSGDDTIDGFNGQDDVIDGGAGNDTINGMSGADTITGGLGDDQLAGGYDSDTYYYNLGDGADTIKEYGAQGALDKIILGAGILASEVAVTRSSTDTDDITLTFIDGGSITLDEQYYDGAQYGVEEIHFDDGTVWDPATLRSMYFANAQTSGDDTIDGFNGQDDVIDGGTGNDTINGMSGEDTITGGLGHDQLAGGYDSDTYYYNLGDGADTVKEYGAQGALDKIILGAGILASEVTVLRSISDTDDVTLHFSDGGSITLDEQFYDGAQYGVEEIHFDDGTVWTSSDLEQIAITNSGPVANDDAITIADDGQPQTILASQLLANDVDADGDTLTILSVDNVANGTVTLDIDGNIVVQREVGSALDTTFSYTVTDGYENATANVVVSAEVISNDTIYGTSGDDDIDGGKGDDQLYGLQGNDTYHYDLGDGNDTITEDSYSGSADTIVLGSGIAANEVTVSRGTSDTNDVTLHFSDGGSILLNDEFRNGTDFGIEEIHFSDSTVWTRATLQSLYLSGAQTSGDDTINGFDNVADTIDGGAGNDTIKGYSGTDTITGGLGNDQIDGGYGNDTYHYDLGDGNDTITEDSNSGSADTIILGSGIAANEVTVSRGTSDTNDVTLHFSDGGSILLNDEFRNGTDFGVEEIHFSDSTVWTRATLQSLYLSGAQTSGDDTINGFDNVADTIDGGAGNDTIKGFSGDDALTGGLGNDQIDGGYGNDTYDYDLGDGNDTITEDSYNGSADTIVLGSGIAVNEVTVSRSTSDTNDVTLHFSDGGSILLNDEFRNGTDFGVEEVHFSDNTVWTRADIAAQSLVGTAADDVLLGFDTDDVIDGGTGNDTITGGSGSDTIHFDFGETGHDTITDFVAGAGTDDVLEFDSAVFADFTSLMAAATDDGTDMTITIDADTSILLQNVVVADFHQDDVRIV